MSKPFKTAGELFTYLETGMIEGVHSGRTWGNKDDLGRDNIVSMYKDSYLYRPCIKPKKVKRYAYWYSPLYTKHLTIIFLDHDEGSENQCLTRLPSEDREVDRLRHNIESKVPVNKDNT